MVALVAVAMGRVDRHVRRHPVAGHQLAREAHHQHPALGGIELGR